MRHSFHLITTTEALQRIFIPSPKSLILSSIRPLPTSQHAHPKSIRSQSSSPLQPSQCRHAQLPGKSVAYRPMPSSDLEPENKPSKPPERKPARQDRDYPPRDDEISAWKVQVVGPDGKLSQPQLLREIIRGFPLDEKGRPTKFIQQVAAANANSISPICKIFDKVEFKKNELEKKKAAKAAKAKKTESKQLELNWAISDNDLEHRLARFREFLAKGSKVEVVFGSKRHRGWKGKKLPSSEEAERLLKKIRGAAEGIEGSREKKDMTGAILGEAVMYFEGSRQT